MADSALTATDIVAAASVCLESGGYSPVPERAARRVAVPLGTCL